jgi:serine/threonine protein kinase
MPPGADEDPAIDPHNQLGDVSPATVPTRPSLIGMKLGGRYLIERELGRGGMGAVYLARDKPELHSRPVVVKVLLEEGLKNDWVVKKFQQEIESLTRLDDPGVIGIFDAGTLDDGTPYLVMQFVDGSNLRALIKPEGINLQQVANIIKQIGRSISAAHDAGILHRDLKPENVMLRKTASGEQQVKIIDFGIAKIRNSMVGPSTVTGMTAGTIGYMSPEQLSAQPLTAASDIYSLGAIAYEMITGRKPFNPDSIYQLLDMQRAGVRVKPADLRPSLPEDAQETILKALCFDPKDRFQRAQDFGDRLAQALNAESDASELTTKDMLERKAREGSRNQSLPPTLPAPAKGEPSPSVPKIDQPSLETAHVLFMDIVSYSSLLIDEQIGRVQELEELVRNTQEFQGAERADQLLRLPTGDGMALSFFGDPEAPVRCAVEVSKALREHSDIKLRMGVHSGLVYRFTNINENLNIAGGGINFAQRVMDCGDAGHILLSKRVADDLGQLSRWKKDLHDLGEAVVKHGDRVHIYNLYNDEIGNAEVPAKLCRTEEKPRSSKRLLIILAAALLLVVLSVAGFFVIKSALTPTRSLTYSLTVQKMTGDQKVGDEIQSTGNRDERYGNGWWYRMNITAAQSGYLYMLNEGTVNYNVLFPAGPNNDHLAANQTMQTGWYFFDENPGIERVWIIYSSQPLSELDTIFKDAGKNAGQQKLKNASQQMLTITDSAQIKTLREIIARYNITESAVDRSKKQSIIKGTGGVLVSLLELEHNSQ